MTNLKGMLFQQYASEGLNKLVEELRTKYKPKKGRRFHHNNITYEIGRSTLKDDKSIEFEISSKIPEDEVKTPKDMKNYFSQIKKIVGKGPKSPVSIEMENIVWDSKKETEKERDYVKLLYQCELDELFDNDTIQKRYEALSGEGKKEEIPHAPEVYTTQGKLVLAMVRETIQRVGKEQVESLIEANKKVRASL
ncbi:MAG: hypothetical protein ACE5EK_05670 [Nitrospinales bacterium]